MPWGVSTYKDLIELSSSLAIVIGLVGYLTSRNQFRFNVMIKCIERYQKMLPNLDTIEREEDEVKRKRIISAYIDLCEEELFYFKKGYLPRELEDEWLEGMLNYLPYFDDTGQVCNCKRKLKLTKNDPLLQGYPRLRKCFGHDMGGADEYEKKVLNLVTKVRNNLEDLL